MIEEVAEMKKIFLKIKYSVILLVLFVSFTACTSGTSVIQKEKAGNKTGIGTENLKQKQISLKLWHIWATDSESNKKPFEKALSDWNESNPGIKIEAEATENETYKTKIRTAVAVNEIPDIFYSWGAGFAKPFVDAKKVLPLNDYLNDETISKLIPGSLDYFTYDNKIYGLPIYMIAGMFYCNKDLFDSNNIKIPDTYNELITAIEAFKAKDIIPMTVGEKDGWPGIFYQNILAIRTAGTKLCNEALNKQASFDKPEFVESALKLNELIKVGAFDSRCMSLTRDEAELDFKNGKVAMYFNGSWVAGSLDREDCPVKGKIIVKNFPYIENSKGDKNGFVGGAIDTFMISSNTKYKDAAVKALKAIDESFCKESYLSGATQPAWKVEVDTSIIKPLVSDISKLLESNTGFVLAWDTFLTGSEAQTHINLVADIFAGRLDPEEFGQEMQKLN